jgi:hypothetical protein
MAITNATEVVPLDGDAVVRAVRDVADGTVQSIVEYDETEFNPLYIDDVTMAFYGDEETMYDHFEEIHSYVHVDFTEMQLFTEELFPVADEVRYLTAGFDTFTLLRIYFDREGLFIALDPDEQVEPIVEAVEAASDSR